jgi:Fe-S-cluster containining protein
MKRNCSLDEISNGKLYSVNDLVETSCNGCKGLASCCHGMGNSIILDPYDIYQLNVKLGITFEQLLDGKIELNIVDGIILPNLKMTEASEGCAFLSDNGKCTIHSYRPGICRIFPLGRYYENHDFKYFLQTNECNNDSKTMVKVSKWIDIPDIKNYQQFLINWHYFLNDVEDIIKSVQDSKLIKNINMFLLNNFYVKNYDSGVDFYLQFSERLSAAQSIIKLA